MTEQPAPSSSTCPWCSATAPAGATSCPSCGAKIAQRDDLAGLTIPGVTGVDPNLLGSPSSLSNPALRTQGTTNVLFATTQVNAMLGLAGAAAILGQDMVKGALGMKDADLATVGVPSDAAIQAAERLDRAPSGGGPAAEPEPSPAAEPEPDPWRDLR